MATDLLCSLAAVLDPRVGHTVDVLSPFISVLCHSDSLFHGESCPRLDDVHPGRACGFIYCSEIYACSELSDLVSLATGTAAKPGRLVLNTWTVIVHTVRELQFSSVQFTCCEQSLIHDLLFLPISTIESGVS